MASNIDFGKCSIGGFTSLTIHGSALHSSEDAIIARLPSVYLGELLKYEIVINRNKNTDLSSIQWKKVISKVSSQASFVPFSSSNRNDIDVRSGNNNSIDTRAAEKYNESPSTELFENETTCTLLSTFVGVSPSFPFPSCVEDSVSRPFFRDEDTFVIPMSSSLQSFTGVLNLIELRVILNLFTLNFVPSQQTLSDEVQDSSSIRKEIKQHSSKETGKDTMHEQDNSYSGAKNSESMPEMLTLKKSTSSTSPDDDEDQWETDSDSPTKVSSGFHSVHEKKVSQKFKVQAAPDVRMRLSCAGQKQFILLTVRNRTEKQMVIKSLEMLSGSDHLQDTPTSLHDSPATKWENCHQLVSLEHPRKGQIFPVIISPCEELSLIFRLHLSSVPSYSELSLICSLKWTHAGATNEVTTVFKLPTIRVNCPPFIVTVKCDDQPEINKPFEVTYNISNQLYDFMSMKLYYNLDNMKKVISDQEASPEERHKVQLVQESVVCQDPLIHTSSCPRGTSIPVRVGFEIHSPGLYEMSELMKVNLGYSLTDPGSSPEHHGSLSGSTDTSSGTSSLEDHLAASHQLWQNRSTSSTSLSQNVEERRQSFADKSYSFGDLGPSSSSNPNETLASRPKSIKRSSAVPPMRPAPPRMLSQSEKDLVQPSNFLKLPFYIYVKDPRM